MKQNLKLIFGLFMVFSVIIFSIITIQAQDNDICEPDDSPEVCGRKIMDAVDDKPSPDKLESTSTMAIVKGDAENPIVKEFKTYTKQYDEDNVCSINKNIDGISLIEFIRPSKIKLLSYSYENKDDDMWLKLSSGAPKRIEGTGKQGEFQNSHLTYEDMETRNLDDYEFKYLGTATIKVEGKESACYGIEAKKIKGDDSSYSKARFYIRVKDLVVVRADMYDKDGKPYKYKQLLVLKTKKMKGNNTYDMITKVVMQVLDDPKTKDVDEGKNQFTIIELGDIKVDANANIDESKFRKESL